LQDGKSIVEVCREDVGLAIWSSRGSFVVHPPGPHAWPPRKIKT
jgi:hypothetical protein